MLINASNFPDVLSFSSSRYE